MSKKARPPALFTRVLSPVEQATGSFDKGAITEQKMIGFAGEGSGIHRIGPLYYWAWAQASQPAAVESHPHRGFEIMSYVLEGTIEHRDTLGHRSRVSAGGMQLMQCGSGLEHEEAFVSTPAQILQIWLDPHFRQQVEVAPRYHAFTADQFPIEEGARIILGERSPITLVTPHVSMQDLSLASKSQGQGMIPGGHGWAAILLKGSGQLQIGTQELFVKERDFVVHQGMEDSSWTLLANEDLRIVWMRVPLILPYPLFPKPR